MEFTRTFMFEGIKRRVSARGVSFSVDMYLLGDSHWNFWVAENDANRDLIQFLLNTKPAAMIDCTLKVVRYDNNISLRLLAAEDAV